MKNVFRTQASHQQLFETQRLKNQALYSSPFVVIAHKVGATPLPDFDETNSYFYNYLSPKLPLFKNLFHSAIGDFSASSTKARKQKINHAYTLGYMDLPFLVIANGLQDNCDPERIKYICHDKIPYLLQQFRRKLTGCETRFEVMREVAQLTEQINQLADINNKFSLAIAVTFFALDGKKKVLSFGVGDDIIFKKSVMGQVTALKLGHVQGAKYLSGAKLDFRKIQFSSEDVSEGDQIFAVTESISHFLGKSDLLKIAQKSKQKEIVAIMESCSVRYSELLRQNRESKSDYGFGGSCSMVGFVIPSAAEISKINREAFVRVANFDLLKEIIFDENYWKTKSHFSLQAPHVIQLMQKIHSSYAEEEFFEWSLLAKERLVMQDFFDKYIYDRRDPVTKALLRVLVDSERLEDLPRNEDFYTVYSDWMRVNFGRSKVMDFSSMRKTACEVYVRDSSLRSQRL